MYLACTVSSSHGVGAGSRDIMSISVDFKQDLLRGRFVLVRALAHPDRLRCWNIGVEIFGSLALQTGVRKHVCAVLYSLSELALESRTVICYIT